MSESVKTREELDAEFPAAELLQPGIFREETQSHHRAYSQLLQFTGSATKAAGFMLIAAIIALVVANTPVATHFVEFWETEVGFHIGNSIYGSMTLAEIINDIFMAIFFLLVGLEIKYEMTVGELTNIRQAALPIIAAFGGVLAPIVIYSLFNGSNPQTSSGWGVPTATDIAFALGLISLLGNRVPSGVRVFLSTLAVADDIIAIIVIAVFYGHSPDAFWLVCSALVFCILLLMNRNHVFSLVPYLLGGVVLWFCVFQSGIHSTIAGVLLAFSIPSTSSVNVKRFIGWTDVKVRQVEEMYDENALVMAQDDYMKTVSSIGRVARQVVPPAIRLEKRLYPWVYFGILPLFALTNADVSFIGADMSQLFGSPALVGVFFGLLLGKPIGIMLFSFITIKLKIASLPANVNWFHMLGAAILGGVGFTMAIFVANLAFTDPQLIVSAKIGILSASFLAGLIGFTFLALQAKAMQKRGTAFIKLEDDDHSVLQTADIHAAQAVERVLANAENPEATRNALEVFGGSGLELEVHVAQAPEPKDVPDIQK